MAPFLLELASSGNVKASSECVGLTRQRLYQLRQEMPEFEAAWDAAMKCAIYGVLEPEAIRRAVEGIDEPVYYKGKTVGTVKKYSDTLLIFLLKAHAPEKYRERFDITSRNANVNIDPADVEPDELNGLIDQYFALGE